MLDRLDRNAEGPTVSLQSLPRGASSQSLDVGGGSGSFVQLRIARLLSSLACKGLSVTQSLEVKVPLFPVSQKKKKKKQQFSIPQPS
jgi:hypothetical protein